MSTRRKHPAVEALGKLCNIYRMTDANLKDLHDYALISLLRAQHEMQQRGIPSSAIVQRAD